MQGQNGPSNISDDYLKSKLTKGTGKPNFEAKEKEQSAKRTDALDSHSRQKVIVRLKPSLSEKLAFNRAVADELESKLERFRLNFNEKLQSTDDIKQELQRRETQLLVSVQKIENYLREIYSLKRKADNLLHDKQVKSKLLDSELANISETYKSDIKLKEATLKTLGLNKPSKIHLENIISELPNYHSLKDLVEYFLVLEALKRDLIEQDKMFQMQEESIKMEERAISEKTRSHPLSILAKESVIHNLKSKTKDIRSQNIDLEQQVDGAMSAKVKEDLIWYDMQRWINKVYESICVVYPPHPDEPKDTIMDRLQKIFNFLTIGTQMVERLKQKETEDIIENK